MASARVNGVQLHYELGDTSLPPLVLVHGSWTSLHGWDFVAQALGQHLCLLRYDRRGHSESERPPGQGSVREDVRDLAALIEHLGLAPAWIAGNSFGASITLRLAGERPDLFRGVIAHEPPLFALLANDPEFAPLLPALMRRVAGVVERIAEGDHAGAAEQFVEQVALGPGMWDLLAEDDRRTMIYNAPTFLDESGDPEQVVFDLDWLRGFSKPMLLTKGDQSPPIFAPVVAALSGAVPQAEVDVFPGAGHQPHQTHPAAYVAKVLDFIRRHGA